MTNLIFAYTLPEKYAIEIPIEKVVSDEKIDIEYVRSMVVLCDEFKPIVVIKHPSEDIYAVLDGHHRFAAARLKGSSKIKAAIVDDYIGLGFELTKIGAFQPTPEFTRYVRLPLKRFIQFMEEFLKNPEQYRK